LASQVNDVSFLFRFIVLLTGFPESFCKHLSQLQYRDLKI